MSWRNLGHLGAISWLLLDVISMRSGAIVVGLTTGQAAAAAGPWFQPITMQRMDLPGYRKGLVYKAPHSAGASDLAR